MMNMREESPKAKGIVRTQERITPKNLRQLFLFLIYYAEVLEREKNESVLLTDPFPHSQPASLSRSRHMRRSHSVRNAPRHNIFFDLCYLTKL